MVTNLLDVMQKKVQKHVKHYQSDFYEHDIPYLLKYARREKQFVWVIRECGTHLYNYKLLTIQGDIFHSMKIFNYYKDVPKKIFLITIDLNTGKSISGSIRPISYEKMIARINKDLYTPKQLTFAYKEDICALDWSDVVNKSQQEIIQIVRKYFNDPNIGYCDCLLSCIV